MENYITVSKELLKEAVKLSKCLGEPCMVTRNIIAESDEWDKKGIKHVIRVSIDPKDRSIFCDPITSDLMN